MMKRKSLPVLVLMLVLVLTSVGVLAEGEGNITQYTVTFNFNGSAQANVTKQVDPGKSVAGVTPQPRTGYTFAEWCSDVDGIKAE